MQNTNLSKMWVLEEVKEWEERVFEEIMAENTPNLIKDTHAQVKNTQWSPGKINTKEIHPKRHYNQTVKSQRQNSESSNREVDAANLTNTLILVFKPPELCSWYKGKE